MLLLNVLIVGTVTAGAPILAFEQIEGTVAYSVTPRATKLFALKVRGESMIQAWA